MRYKGKIYGKIQGKYVELEEKSVTAISIIEKRIEELENCNISKMYLREVEELKSIFKQIKDNN